MARFQSDVDYFCAAAQNRGIDVVGLVASNETDMTIFSIKAKDGA